VKKSIIFIYREILTKITQKPQVQKAGLRTKHVYRHWYDVVKTYTRLGLALASVSTECTIILLVLVLKGNG